jgi:restriction endonuclease Mrr
MARLAEFIIRYGIGVTTRRRFDVKEVDEDFFAADFLG